MPHLDALRHKSHIHPVTRRAWLGTALGLGLLASVAFVACGGPKSAPAPVPARQPSSPNSATATAPPASPAASTAAVGPAPAPANTVAAAAASARVCDAPTSTITNQPKGGVVFVNAWHRKDAGNIDRLEGIVGALGAASRQFRCCFDVWAASHPAGEGHLVLQMEVEASGAVAAASILASSTDIDHEISRACVLQVAESLTYPESPSSQATLVEYPFVVRAP